MKYRYNEDKTLKELKEYIDNTYGEHYSQGKYQVTEYLIDLGYGLDFCLGNIIKYSARYGKKGGYNRKDLMKAIHYGIIALSIDPDENK